MICPDCKSVLIVQTPSKIEVDEVLVKHYLIDCNRCLAELRVTVTIKKPGDPELVKKTQDWLFEDRK